MTIRYDMSMDDYRGANGVSASDLKNMQRSPAYAHLRPSKPSEAKDWGTAVHCAVLEPDQLGRRYGIDPEAPKGGYPAGWRNTKEYKARREMLLGSYDGLVTAREYDDLMDIAKRVAENKIGQTMHALAGYREASVFVVDEVRDLVRKCRPDWLIPDARMIVDAKTTSDHRPAGFARACLAYGYHMSAAYYLDTISVEMDVEHYVFLAVNAEPPYEVASYTLDRDSIEQGRCDYKRALDAWQKCAEAGQWPGGSDEIQEIRLPEYSINYHQEDRDLWQ